MSKRLTNLDGLRGLAALLVVVGHWSEFVANHARGTPLQHALTAMFLEYFSAGRTGIVAFFCISGFVIPFSFRGSRPETAFVLSRFFRLYPAYWLSMAVGLLTERLVNHPAPSPLAVAANATMLPLFLHALPIIGVYWTLHIEMIFYGLCFIMFAVGVLHDARANFWAMLLFLAVAVIGSGYRYAHPASNLPIGLPTYLAAMHFGTLARLRLLEHDPRARRLFPSALVLLVCGVLVANTSAYRFSTTEVMGWVATNTGYLAGLALFLACVTRNMFSGRVLAFLGLVSYSLYLFHVPVIQVWEHLWPHIPDWRVAAAAGTLFVFGAAILVAAVVQRYLEAPMIRTARRLERALERATPSSASRPTPTGR